MQRRMRMSIANEDDIQQICPYLYVGSRYAATGRLSADNYSDYLSLFNIKNVISILTEEEYLKSKFAFQLVSAL